MRGSSAVHPTRIARVRMAPQKSQSVPNPVRRLARPSRLPSPSLHYRGSDPPGLDDRQFDAARLNQLVHAPLRGGRRKILPLVCAAALESLQRSLRNGARHEEHIAQIEPFEPLQIEGPPAMGWQFAELPRHVLELGNCMQELRSGPERARSLPH